MIWYTLEGRVRSENPRVFGDIEKLFVERVEFSGDSVTVYLSGKRQQ